MGVFYFSFIFFNIFLFLFQNFYNLCLVKRLKQNKMKTVKQLNAKRVNLVKYLLDVTYVKGYFENSATPLNQTLEFNSIGERTIEQIQRMYPHCTVNKITKL